MQIEVYIEDGTSKIRADWVYFGVDLFGAQCQTGFTSGTINIRPFFDLQE